MNMKQMTWALGLIGLLLVGSAIPAEVVAGGPGGRGGGARSAGGGGHGGHGGHGGGGYYGGRGGYYGGGYYGGSYPYRYGGAGWWGAPYLYYYGGVPSPMPTPPRQTYWLYCQDSNAYYPYVTDCPGGWMQVEPQSVSPGQ
jgi:hypothetical protein